MTDCTIDGNAASVNGGGVGNLGTATLTTGRASYLVRGLTPVNKLVNRLRGNVRIQPGSSVAG